MRRVVLIIPFKRISLFLIPLLFLTQSPAASAESAPSVSAASCVLMYEDGQMLYARCAEEKSLIASTTKLMTALVCLENTKLEDSVRVSATACAVEGSSVGLRAGESYSVRELMLGLLLASGNDAALALAEHVSGSVQAFVGLMNQKAEALGLTHTHFANPHGLDAPEHFSTANDLARLMLVCMQNERFCELIASPSMSLDGKVYLNHNRLLRSCPGCIGGKTGYTMAAGRCLVSCCERAGLRFVCVTLSDPDDWKDHWALYDWAFRSYRAFDPGKELRLRVPAISGDRKEIAVEPLETKRILIPAQETVRLEAELPRFIFAPVKKGETAGKIRVIIKQKTAAEYTLVYSETVNPAVQM